MVTLSDVFVFSNVNVYTTVVRTHKTSLKWIVSYYRTMVVLIRNVKFLLTCTVWYATRLYSWHLHVQVARISWDVPGNPRFTWAILDMGQGYVAGSELGYARISQVTLGTHGTRVVPGIILGYPGMSSVIPSAHGTFTCRTRSCNRHLVTVRHSRMS